MRDSRTLGSMASAIRTGGKTIAANQNIVFSGWRRFQYRVAVVEGGRRRRRKEMMMMVASSS